MNFGVGVELIYYVLFILINMEGVLVGEYIEFAVIDEFSWDERGEFDYFDITCDDLWDV